MSYSRRNMLAIALLVVVLLPYLFKIFISPPGEVDFRFFWLAGKLWRAGIDPYSSAFLSSGRELLPPGNLTEYWFYPPQWWIICTSLSLFSLEKSVMIWRVLSCLILIAGSTALVSGMMKHRTRAAYLSIAFIAFVFLIEPTPMYLAYGQSSAMLFLSLALLCYGMIVQNKLFVAVAIFLATFKPQFGAPMMVAVMVLPQYRGSVILGACAAGAACLPQLIAFGPLLTLQEFLQNSASWSALPGNTPLTATGTSHIIARVGLGSTSLYVQLVLATIAMTMAAWYIRKNPSKQAIGLILFSAAAMFFLPMHSYDFSLLAIPLALYIHERRKIDALSAVVGLAMIRPGKVEVLMGLPQYGSGLSAGALILTICAAMLAVGGLFLLLRSNRQTVGTV